MKQNMAAVLLLQKCFLACEVLFSRFQSFFSSLKAEIETVNALCDPLFLNSSMYIDNCSCNVLNCTKTWVDENNILR